MRNRLTCCLAQCQILVKIFGGRKKPGVRDEAISAFLKTELLVLGNRVTRDAREKNMLCDVRLHIVKASTGRLCNSFGMLHCYSWRVANMELNAANNRGKISIVQLYAWVGNLTTLLSCMQCFHYLFFCCNVTTNL